MSKSGYSLRETIESQITRANELYSELESEVKKDLLNSRVSPRTSEITEEIIVKLRICLDKGINQYRELKKQPTSRNLYFPISFDEEKFKNKLTSSGLHNLNKTDPDLYALLHNVQPFIAKEYEILIEIDEQGSKKKHRELSFQEKEVVGERITFSKNSGNGSISWNPAGVRFGQGVSMLGVPVDPNTQLPQNIPSKHSLTKERLISVKFQGKNVDVLQFCKQSINAVQKIVNQIILLSEKA